MGMLAPGSDAPVEVLTARTLELVRTRYAAISNDGGVQAAFGFLVALSSPASGATGGASGAVIDLDADPSAIQLGRQLQVWVRQHANSLEYAALAERAACAAIAGWWEGHSRQQSLMGPVAAADVWRAASQGSGFSELARSFFAKFTESYLNYFLGREASAVAGTIQNREALQQGIREHTDRVSKHAFETSKIAQSFAAGWFNKYAVEERPSDRRLQGFLRVAFEKLREELLRESSP